jgi:hypothetical protein
MTGLRLSATSRAEEAGYLAIRDIAILAAGSGIDYRLVGGQMVSLHVAAADVAEPELRQTLDADLGVARTAAADPALVAGLSEMGYRRPHASNRFEREDSEGRKLIIDLLAPSFGKRMVTNQRHGDVTLDEIPGLSLALARPGESLELSVTFLDGTVIEMVAVVPDPLAALCVKTLGWYDRRESRDALDVWRLLRVFRARVSDPHPWPNAGVQGDTADVLRSDFVPVSGAGGRAASSMPAERAEIRALALHALRVQG